MHIKNVIFDLDGTLIDSSDGVVEAVNYSLRQMGEKERQPEEIKAFIGFPLSQMYPHFTDAPVDELYRHFRVVANSSVPAAAIPLPGAVEAIRRLHGRGLRLAIATTKVRQNIDVILEKLDWLQYFEVSVGGDEVKNVKPEPDAFLYVLEKMNARATESIAVGDTINDVLAARAVPLPVVGVKSPYQTEDIRRLNPEHYIETISELPALLNMKRGER